MYGLKYMTYIGEELHIYRISRFKNENTIVLTDQETNETVTVSDEDLKNKYVCLTPDAFMNVFITDTKIKPNFYVAVQRPGHQMPELVANQVFLNVTSQFASNRDNRITVGDCINEKCNPSSEPVVSIMDFEEIDDAAQVAIYIEDNLDEILKNIPAKHMDIFNNQLKKIKKELANEMTDGYCESVKEFLEQVHFIIRFREIFNIGYIDWPIEIDDSSYNSEGDIILNNKQKTRLEDYLRMNITDVKVIKYGKDIDISKTIEVSHVIVSDISDNIYIIAFVKLSDYPIDADIANAFGIVQ